MPEFQKKAFSCPIGSPMVESRRRAESGSGAPADHRRAEACGAEANVGVSSRRGWGPPPVEDGRLAAVAEAIVACDACPRLRAYCATLAREKRRAFRDEVYWGKPVPGFGDPRARLLLVGLAPAAHGANRTGRVFTGDGVGGSGDFLMAALHRARFAEHADVAASRRRPGAARRTCITAAAQNARQQADARRDR